MRIKASSSQSFNVFVPGAISPLHHPFDIPAVEQSMFGAQVVQRKQARIW